MNLRLTLVILLFFTSHALFSQTGILKGTVTDAKTKEPLVGATVMLEGTTIGTITDFDGNYTIGNIKTGTYTLRCSFISYETKLVPNVQIKTGQPLTYNFNLGESTVEIGGIDVVAKVNRQSESMLLIEQKNSVLTTQAVGAQEISRKGVSDAEGAVTKVSGISKQEGVKNVFVRGLGDRFNSTSLNGFPVPSEDPEYKNISLDFFSSDMIQSVGVNKVFSSGITGDVGGADINILSKELTQDSDFGVGISVGVNDQTVSQQFLKPDGVSGLGFAKNSQGPLDLTKYAFKNSLDPTTQDLQLNQGFSVSGGKKTLIGGAKNPLSFFVLGSYDHDYFYGEGVVRNTTTTGTIFQDQDYQKYTQNTAHLLMANLDYRFKGRKLSYNGLYIHTNQQSVGDYSGLNSVYEDAQNYQGLLRRQQVNDNSLIVNQLSYETKISNRWLLNAGSAFNMVMGDEPDRKMNYLSYYGNGIYHATKGTGRQQRYFSTLKENDLNLKLVLSYRLTEDDDNKSTVNFGYNGRLVHRTFEAIEYDQQVVNQPDFTKDNISLDNFFNQTGLTNGDFQLDRNRDEYTVDKMVHSAFGEMIWQFSKKLVGVGGLRLDKVNMDVDYNVNRGGTKGKTSIDDLYILPSVNLKYALNDKNSLRIGISRTYTLPQAKEISPFRYIDVSFKSQGNTELKTSTNNNLDVKWDYYLSSDELISVAGFYKYIQDPISRVEKASAGGFLTYDNIADHSTVEGVEVEIRKNIFKTGDENKGATNKLSAGLNASYIISEVKLEDANFTNSKSDLEGAAPFILNADLSYNLNKNNFSLTNSLVLNYFSDRIYTIGTQGYQDIVEKGVPTLDFITSVKMNKHWGMSLKVKNILNPDYQLSRKPNVEGNEPIILNNYQKGLQFSFGLSYSL